MHHTEVIPTPSEQFTGVFFVNQRIQKLGIKLKTLQPIKNKRFRIGDFALFRAEIHLQALLEKSPDRVRPKTL